MKKIAPQCSNFYCGAAAIAIRSEGSQIHPTASYKPVRSAPMKYVSAVIKPQKLDEVRAALQALGVSGLTVTDVRGYGRQKGHTEVYRGAEYAVDFRPKVKIDVAIPSDRLDAVVAAIRDKANSGSIGDGKIFVFELLNVIRVRTGEAGADAL
jgi:nitrogen regulatory protein P-II 2